MFLDALLTLSDAQALTATALSTNTIDLGNPSVKNRIGSGEPMALVVTLDVAADFTTGDEAYTIQLISSAAANLSTPTVLDSVAITTAAQRAVGAQIVIMVPKGQPLQRYLGVNYVLGGTTPTVTVTAEIIPASMVQDQAIYAKGYNN
jgi:hypothetical protein